MPANDLMHFNKAKRELALATRLDEVKNIRDRAEALRAYTKQAGESLEMQNQCAEIKLRAERRAGELLAGRESHPGGRPRKNPSHDASGFESLEELGISHSQSSRWQTIANIPEDKFERVIATTQERQDELTTAGMLRAAKLGVHFSSDSPEWNTPPEIIERVKRLFRGQIDLDPCSNSKTAPNVPAKRHFALGDDGLAQRWRGTVYMNPPYGQQIGAWVEHLCEQYENGLVREAIALVPSRTDTVWFARFRPYPRCFIRGRLRFSDLSNTAPFPSMAVYLGSSVKRFVEAFHDLGDIYAVVCSRSVGLGAPLVPSPALKSIPWPPSIPGCLRPAKPAPLATARRKAPVS